MRLRMNIYPLRNALEVGSIIGTNFFSTLEKSRITKAAEFGYRPYQMNKNVEKWFDLYKAAQDTVKNNDNFQYSFGGLQIKADFINFVPQIKVLNSWHFNSENGAILTDIVVKDVASSVKIDTKEESKFLTSKIVLGSEAAFKIEIKRADGDNILFPVNSPYDGLQQRIIAVYSFNSDCTAVNNNVLVYGYNLTTEKWEEYCKIISYGQIQTANLPAPSYLSPFSYLTDKNRIEALLSDTESFKQAIETLLKIPTEPQSYTPKVELSTNEFEFSISTEFVELELLNQLSFSDSRANYGFAIFDIEKYSSPALVINIDGNYGAIDTGKCYAYGILTGFQYDFPRGLIRFTGQRATLPIQTEGNGF